MSRAAVGLTLLLAPWAASCGSMQTRTFTVETVPPGAVVNVNGLCYGAAPCSVTAQFRGRHGRSAVVEVLPPKDSSTKLFTQSRTIDLYMLPDVGAKLYFDLRLEQTLPLRPYEIRDR